MGCHPLHWQPGLSSALGISLVLDTLGLKILLGRGAARAGVQVRLRLGNKLKVCLSLRAVEPTLLAFF